MRLSSNFQRRMAAALAWSSASTAIAIACATPAHAQVSGASLRGTITAEGGVSQVSAVNVDTGLTRTVSTGTNGSYNFASLPAGTYRLEVTTPDGVRRTDNFTLSVAQNAVLNFDLSAPPVESTAEAAPDSEAIIVVGSRIKSMEGGEVGVNISQRMIEQLPQNNRNFLAFADLAPGVQFITDASGNSRLQGGAQASSTVNVFIDGVGQKDYVLKNGVTGQDTSQGNPFPQLAVGEYRVISSNYKAEFDQVSSVAITAVTKSGTNEFHGEGFIDFTNQSLRDRLPRELFPVKTDKVKTRDIQFGGALGGPIIQDMLHFFVTYEGKRIQSPVEITPGFTGPYTLPSEYQQYFGTTNKTFNEDLYFAKLNFTPTTSDLFELSGKYRKESGSGLGNGFAAEETRSLSNVDEKRGLFRWEHTADSWINDFKVAYEDVTWGQVPALDAPGRQFVFGFPIPGSNPLTYARGDILRIGGSQGFQQKGQTGWTFSNDFTFIGLENHTIKMGVKAKWIKLNTREQNNLNPIYRYNVAYPNNAAFNDDIPYEVQFNAPFPNADPQITSKNFQFGAYIQDDWDVTDRLTLNLGVRWDYERTPAFLNYQHSAEQIAAVGPANYPNLVNADYDINDYISTGSERKAFTGAWQPRVGFSYKLDDEDRFVIFGGYGRSYDRTQFDYIQQELGQGVSATRTFRFYVPGAPDLDPQKQCSPPSATCVAWDPVYLTQAGRDQLVAGLPVAVGGREMRFIDNNLKMPYSDQFSLGARGRFGLLDAEVGYSHVISKDGFAYLLGNRRPDGSFFPPAAQAPDSPFGFAPPGWGAIILGTNGIKTRADTTYLKLTKRYSPSSRWSLDATYTHTAAKENRQFGEYFSLDFPTLDDYPFLRSSGVRKHRFVMAGSVDIPGNAIFSAKFQIASPSYIKGQLPDQAGRPRDIIVTETESNGDRWGMRQLDFAITKNFPLGFLSEQANLRLRVDIINVMNDRNYTGFEGWAGSPNFGQRLQNNWDVGGNPPRTVKVSAGFSF